MQKFVFFSVVLSLLAGCQPANDAPVGGNATTVAATATPVVLSTPSPVPIEEPPYPLQTRLVAIPDANLAACIDAHPLAPKQVNFQEDYDRIRVLRCDYFDIESLEGIENLNNLVSFSAPMVLNSGNIAPLTQIPQLEELRLHGSQISDLQRLQQANNLLVLDIGMSPVADISSLAGLTQLRQLYLDGTDVTDLSPVYGLPLELLAGRLTESDHTHFSNLPSMNWLWPTDY